MLANSLTAILRNAEISHKKINLIAKMVRGKPVGEALTFLRFLPKKGADILGKVIKSAAANAQHNAGHKLEALQIASIEVGRGRKLKRMRFVGRARIHGYVKHRANVTVILQPK